jgi:hypothetical protein
MTYSPRYIRDSLGRQRAVQISVKNWREIEKKLKEAEFLTRLRNDLDEAFEDVRLHQDGKIKLKTARELLAEL